MSITLKQNLDDVQVCGAATHLSNYDQMHRAVIAFEKQLFATVREHNLLTEVGSWQWRISDKGEPLTHIGISNGHLVYTVTKSGHQDHDRSRKLLRDCGSDILEAFLNGTAREIAISVRRKVAERTKRLRAALGAGEEAQRILRGDVIHGGAS